jgi:hypothetical protein
LRFLGYTHVLKGYSTAPLVPHLVDWAVPHGSLMIWLCWGPDHLAPLLPPTPIPLFRQAPKSIPLIKLNFYSAPLRSKAAMEKLSEHENRISKLEDK